MLRFIGWIVSLLVIGAVGGTVAFFAVLYYFGRGLPDYAQLQDYEPPVVSRLYAGDGRLFAEYATEKRIFVPVESIPKRVIDTFLAAEDKNFWTHSGLDFTGIIRAALINLKNMGSHKRPMGASTITQQVAKNMLLADMASKASYERKIKEAILAFRIEKALTKKRILELYLNEIFLGGGAYGVAAAAQNYFGKTLDELTAAESAFLAALPKAPSYYNPRSNPVQAKTRRDWVISRMAEEGILTAEEAKAAQEEPFNLRSKNFYEGIKGDYFAEEVRRHLLQEYGDSVIYQGGLTVKTTMDPKLQDLANQSLRDGLVNYDRRHGYRGPIAKIDPSRITGGSWKDELLQAPKPAGLGGWTTAIVLSVANDHAEIGLRDGSKGTIKFEDLKWARKDLGLGRIGSEVKKTRDVLDVGYVVVVEKKDGEYYSLQQIPAVTGALVVMDAYSGRVLAMTGGWSFDLSQFNCATQAMRQPGSAIKPFIYLTAMEKGFTPATIVSDSPIAISLGTGLGTYTPKNVTERFYGPVPMRIGLQKSLNMLTVRLAHEYVGMRPIKEMVEKFGITKDLPLQLAMVLGAGETTVLKLTNAYAMLANGGRSLNPILIDRIQDRNGKTIYKADHRKCVGCATTYSGDESVPQIEDDSPFLVDPRSAYQITSMLEGAVRAGSAQRAQSIKKVVAAKTGTTNDERDAWTLGYAPNGLVVGVFVGFPTPRHMGNKEGGARVALPIFVDFMTKALDGTPSVPFKTPPGIKLVRLNEMTGQPPLPGDKGIIWEVFKNNVEVVEAPNTVTYGESSEGVENLYNSRYKDNTMNGEVADLPMSDADSSVSGTGGLY